MQHKVKCSTFVPMGCITSKVMTKSMSFHKEMSHSLHRTTDGIPGSNQFLDQPSSTETIKPWEFNAGLEQHRVKQEGQHEDPSLPSPSVLDKLDIYKAKRSKSSHWSPEYEIPTQCPGILSSGLLERNSKGGVRVLSF